MNTENTMGKTKDIYMELCQVEMTRQFYEQHQELFENNECKLKAAYAVNPNLKDHPDRKILLDELLKAKEALLEWEYEQHYKRNIKNYD